MLLIDYSAHVGLNYRIKVIPNTVVLTTAINALAKEGASYTDTAYEMLLKMEKDGPEPNIYTYNTVTRAFAEAGRLQVSKAFRQNCCFYFLFLKLPLSNLRYYLPLISSISHRLTTTILSFIVLFCSVIFHKYNLRRLFRYFAPSKRAGCSPTASRSRHSLWHAAEPIAQTR